MKFGVLLLNQIFKSWDSSAIEKIHLQFGKRFLQVHNEESNIACRAELGKFPMIIDINKKILNYLDYLIGKDEDSIVKQALQISIDLHHNGKTSFYSNLMKMVDYYDLNYDFSCNSLSDSIVNRYIGIMKNKYVSYWNQTLQQSQKLSFYCTIKDDYISSPYLVLTRKKHSRKALVRFRISSHQLRIETGRYENIPRNERICHFCTSNKIEDENHFLLDCKAYPQIRDIFFFKLETKIPDFKTLSHDTLISLVMNSSDYLINC